MFSMKIIIFFKFKVLVHMMVKTSYALFIMYLSTEIFTCPKEQIVHKELSFALTVL